MERFLPSNLSTLAVVDVCKTRGAVGDIDRKVASTAQLTAGSWQLTAGDSDQTFHLQTHIESGCAAAHKIPPTFTRRIQLFIIYIVASAARKSLWVPSNG